MVHLFNEENIALLIEQGYEVHVACNFIEGNTISDAAVQAARKSWEERGIVCHHIDFLRTPFSFKSIDIYKRVKKLIRGIGFDLIHCHTPIVSIFARYAARKMRKKGQTRVIYTAHGFHFYTGAPLKNWLIFYTMEWICSFHTDVIITINEEDYKRSKKRFHAGRTEYIPGIGIDYLSIRDIRPDKKEYLAEFGVGDEPVLISVGELSDRKNHIVMLKAVKDIDRPFKYIIAGRGYNDTMLRDKIKEFGLEDKVIMAGFRSDVKELLACADIFCFPSIQEGLPVALMEAMASGLPAVASNIRGNTDLIDKDGGVLCDAFDVDGFRKGVDMLLADADLRKSFGEHNLERIEEFSIDIVRHKLYRLYFDKAKDAATV